ncbi:glycosyltransferase [Carboxylicivirga sp. N1Y90]|uniref:glycosyltransferase n=1 Tax=Carboxylicivirga fragile TaxID=3417571 RepID=UPI003D331ECA|nr:glycosyltransferase family 2 protein [Marinilabiliaceae bacterium N1Y90]
MSSKIFDKYFSKHPLYKSDNELRTAMDLRVVIPVYLEEDYLFDTLKSLEVAASSVAEFIEVVLVFNYASSAPVSIKTRQAALYESIKSQKDQFSESYTLSLIKAFNLPDKRAGAGLARKIGMDYAAYTFVNAANFTGPIISLDADCKVESNYFTEVLKVFKQNKTKACTIYFEHPIDDLSSAQSEAIMQYELHLRYYKQALQWTEFPYAYHTVGSCFAVSAEYYIRAGGMPRKQAGEDFYFLQKVIPMGHFTELNTTCVYPSSRTSERVPFGTGPSVATLMEANEEYYSYNWQAFVDLKAFFCEKEKMYRISNESYTDLLNDLSGPLRSYLLNSDFYSELESLNQNCSSIEVFNKRFFAIFNAFKVVKYLNYVHVHFFEKVPVFDLALDFLESSGKETEGLDDTQSLLLYFRQIEKE